MGQDRWIDVRGDEAFREVYPGLSSEEAYEEAERCLQCKDPRCRSGCPAMVDVKGFIERLRSHDLEGSVKVIMRTNLLPGTTARVCQVERQCQGSCVLSRTGRPIRIGLLQRYVADNTVLKGRVKLEAKPSNGYKIAVIGVILLK